MSWMTRIAHELEEVGLVTLYFLFCFGMILTLKKLFLADYEIKSYALGSAVISALIAAKIVVILDKTRTGTRFDRSQPTGIAAGYKTLMYMAVAALVLFGEHMFHAYREFGSARQGARADLGASQPKRDHRQGALHRPDLRGLPRLCGRRPPPR